MKPNLLNIFESKKCDELFKCLDEEKKLILSWVSNHSAKSFLATYFLKKYKNKNIFWICGNSEEVLDIKKWLFLWTQARVNMIYWELSDLNKINIVSNISNSKWQIFLICSNNLNDTTSPIEDIEKLWIHINVWEPLEYVKLFSSLLDINYSLSLDKVLEPWMYQKNWWIIDIYPVFSAHSIKVEISWDKVVSIFEFDQVQKKIIWELKQFLIYPNCLPQRRNKLIDNINDKDLIIIDEKDSYRLSDIWALSKIISNKIIEFNSFPEEKENHYHLRFLSVIKFYSVMDLLSDLRQKIKENWTIVVCVKRYDELVGIFKDKKFIHWDSTRNSIHYVKLEQDVFIPHSFQNPDEKFLFLSEKEIFTLQKNKRNQSATKMSIDFITSLKDRDYVVHFDHWIWLFLWLTKKEIDWINREYLEIAYQWSDKLFVPIDQVDKVSKHLVENWIEPKLSKLWSANWKSVQRKVKKETQEMAKELLELYAKRAETKRRWFLEDSLAQKSMEKDFPYELTPGQAKAILDIKKDMELDKPMDRLLVWDVWFGKTEIAVRAAFKATESWKQVAIIAPVTILAIQHFETFTERVSKYWKKVAVLTRFKTAAEQKKILLDLEKWRIDIVVWTHRLLSQDVKFFNIWLLVIDEEHRFWVKQKEKLKEIRNSVDILTMTATPIPRTLNMWLNKIRDITTITTPPPWRLPIISEVRRYSDYLVRDAIINEVKRGGQVFYLHNRVETIEWIAEKLRQQIPEVTFIVAHWQLNPHTLEERIMKFKNKEFDVLISSTIIENWIDLASANTMVVNNAEKFGLSQLYQLRWRIWRSNIQAYAFFLYHSQWLSLDAKKRLRAIIEASELWSWFQIAMKDLEIRWAWDILWCKQSWTMNIIWASHYLRLLNKTIEELRYWRKLSWWDMDNLTTIELPIDAIVPENYVPDPKEKMSVYQKLSAVSSEKMLNDIIEDVVEEYWPLPRQVKNLCRLLNLKMLATKAKIVKIFTRTISSNNKEIVFTLWAKCSPNKIIKVLDVNSKWQIRGDSIAITMNDLPVHWLMEIEKSVKIMK